ncbi:Tantalus domain-containing protein [Caenorhabditis elegans]|uniref:Tantalus domain-containing protein n=1 Tax=Caenorhabditis elegans TaxID=6239 RepID=A0A1N7SYW9_CAEEL|nr:Tantalus domain-containing protein [Caenorhabditis elegans]SIT60426.1 Tantalus domain-containing protein [Caenorhabditis elegans]|eukprot:NP_001335536.1 Uncharacterized protein CELE_T14B4.19 [Caenorhabditis elegans]
MNPVTEVVEETVVVTSATAPEQKKKKKSVKEVKRSKTKKDENQNDIPDSRPKFLCVPLGRPSLLRKGRKASYTFSSEDLRKETQEIEVKKTNIFTFFFDTNTISKNEKQRQRRLSNVLADNELFASDDLPVCHRSSNRI